MRDCSNNTIREADISRMNDSELLLKFVFYLYAYLRSGIT